MAIGVIPSITLVFRIIVCESIIYLCERIILSRRSYFEPTLSVTSTIFRTAEICPVRSRLRIGCTRGSNVEPLINHYTILVKMIIFTIGFPGVIVFSMGTFFTVCFEVEPIVIIIILITGRIMNSNFLPASLHGTIFPGTKIVLCIFPVRIIGCKVSIIFLNPAIQHLTIIIECIFLAIDGFEFYVAAIASFVSFTAGLHVVVTILSRIIIILILVNNFNPGIGNHNTVAIYIVGIVVIFNELIGSHCATLFGIKPEPVVSGFFPLVFYSIAIFVIVVPGTIFLNPTLSCERSHSTTDS